MNTLLFPAGGHFLAACAALTEILLAIGDRGRPFANDLGFEISNNGFDLPLLQARCRWRRLFVTDLFSGHAKAFFALGPREFVEMRHRRAAGDAAADGLDQLVVVELALAQIGGLARRMRVAGAVAGPAVAEAAGRLFLIEPLAQPDVAGGLRSRRLDDGQRRRESGSKCEAARHSRG